MKLDIGCGLHPKTPLDEWVHLDIDPGGSQFTEWKARYAGEHMAEYQDLASGLRQGVVPVYYSGRGRMEVDA